MMHLPTQDSCLARAFCTSGSKKVVCSCLQDIDLVLDWYMNFSPFFIRKKKWQSTLPECGNGVHAQMPFKDCVGMSAKTGNLGKIMFQNLYGDQNDRIRW